MSIIGCNKLKRILMLVAIGWIATSIGCSSYSSRSVRRAQLGMVDDRLPLLHVIINGKPAAFVIDTGAESTHIKPEAARRLGLVIRKSNQKTNDAHMAIRRVLGVVNIDGITTSNIQLHGQQAWCMDLPLPDGVDGLLSRSAFVDHVLTIDYPNRTMILDEPSPDPRSPNTVAIGVHAQGAIRVPVTIEDKLDWYMVDTGFAGMLSMDDQSLKQTRRRLIRDDHQSAGVNSQITTSVYQLISTANIGPHDFKNSTVLTFPGVKKMIGSGLLMDYRITIDQKNRLFSLEKSERNPSPTVRPSQKN